MSPNERIEWAKDDLTSLLDRLRDHGLGLSAGDYLRVWAVYVRAFETGQLALAPAACCWNVASSMSATAASVVSSILVMVGPASVISRWARADVDTLAGENPERPRAAANAIEKHPACAAAISSSGLVPGSSSKREPKEYFPS